MGGDNVYHDTSIETLATARRTTAVREADLCGLWPTSRDGRRRLQQLYEQATGDLRRLRRHRPWPTRRRLGLPTARTDPRRTDHRCRDGPTLTAGTTDSEYRTRTVPPSIDWHDRQRVQKPGPCHRRSAGTTEREASNYVDYVVGRTNPAHYFISDTLIIQATEDRHVGSRPGGITAGDRVTATWPALCRRAYTLPTRVARRTHNGRRVNSAHGPFPLRTR